MQVTKTDNSLTNVTLLIAGETDELLKIKRHVLSHFTRQVKVPGFRAGKAPLHLVEKNTNPQRLNDEFIEHSLNELFQKAVGAHKLRPVGQPQITVKKFVPYAQLEFEATFDVVGEVKLANYKAIKLPKPTVEVNAKDVDDVIENLRKQAAERIDVEHPAKIGDEVWIDFSGTDDKNEPVAGADGKNYPLILGSKTFIPGFEENLVGVKPQDENEFTVTFPADYGVSALANKKVKFSVKVNKVQEVVLPKVDDEFVKKVGPFDGLASLKADIKKQVKSEKQNQADRNYENELIKKMADKSSIQIPESLIDNQISRMEEEEKQNLTYRGLTWQEHLAQEGITEQEHRDRQRPDAEARVKAGLVLSEIADQEGIDVMPDELEIRMQMLKGQYQDPQMLAQLDKPEARQDIAARMLTEKTILKLVDYASK
jgi:trigger factor